MQGKKMIALFVVLFVVVSVLCSPLHLKADDDYIDEMVNHMTTKQKIEQMLMPDFRQWKKVGDTSTTDVTVVNEEIASIIDKYNFGGVILFANNVKDTDQTLKLTTDLQAAALRNTSGETYGNIPLLLSIDQEGGIVYRLGSGTALPGNMAIGATRSTQNAMQAGQVIGRELSALDINVNFAPDFDVNNNPNNPVIGLRSFSSDPTLVADLGVAMMQGMQQYAIATAAKHFPGHGDTATDSHTGLPRVNKSYEDLKKVELFPFQAAIDHGVDMIMTAHIQYPQIETTQVISKKDGKKIYLPATLSHKIITDILRDQMHFDGVVVTDALNMDAIAQNFGEIEAVEKAMNAGVDICLMPVTLRSMADVTTLDNMINTLVSDVDNKIIPMSRLNESVKRILMLKEKRGILHYTLPTDFNKKLAFAEQQVGSAENRAIERELSEQAVTVVKNEDTILPYKPAENANVLLIATYPNEQPGMELSMRRLIAEGVIPKSTTYESVNYNPSKGIDLATIKQKIDHADYVIVISEISGASQMDTTSQGSWLANRPFDILNYANEQQVPATIMSISKPYDLAIYPQAKAAVAVYGNKGMDPTEAMAPSNAFGPNIPAGVEVIFGGHGAQGKLPVDINVVENSVITDKVLYPIGTGITYKAVSKEPIQPENPQNPQKPLPSVPQKPDQPLIETTTQVPDVVKKPVEDKTVSIRIENPNTGDANSNPSYLTWVVVISAGALGYISFKKRKAKHLVTK